MCRLCDKSFDEHMNSNVCLIFGTIRSDEGRDNHSVMQRLSSLSSVRVVPRFTYYLIITCVIKLLTCERKYHSFS